LIFHISFRDFNFSPFRQHIPIKWPEIDNEFSVNDYQAILVALANTKLNVTALPKYAQEDGHYIMNELRENLDECRHRLANDHMLWQYKVCVHQHLDTSDNRIWDLVNSLSTDSSREDNDDDDSGSMKLAMLMPVLAMSVVASHFL
jgi:hypothetical protein